jgi:hypothetical protein
VGLRGPWGAVVCLVGAAACDRSVPAALGTKTGQPLLVGLEEGSAVQLGSLESSPLRVRLDTTTGDSAYHSTWTLGAGTCLEVVPRTGAAVRVVGTPLAADYYHVGRVLFVVVGEEGRQELSSFVEPISYRTVPCPEVAAAVAARASGAAPANAAVPPTPRPEAE